MKILTPVLLSAMHRPTCFRPMSHLLVLVLVLLQLWLQHCQSYWSDSPHHRCTDYSIVFARWRQWTAWISWTSPTTRSTARAAARRRSCAGSTAPSASGSTAATASCAPSRPARRSSTPQRPTTARTWLRCPRTTPARGRTPPVGARAPSRRHCSRPGRSGWRSRWP